MRTGAVRFSLGFVILLAITGTGLAATKTANGSGNWSTIPWIGGLPVDGDDVIIPNTINVTLDSNQPATGSLVSLTVGGGASGKLTFGMATLSVSGNVTVNAGGTIDNGNKSATFKVGGNITNNGLFSCYFSATKTTILELDGTGNTTITGGGTWSVVEVKFKKTGADPKAVLIENIASQNFLDTSAGNSPKLEFLIGGTYRHNTTWVGSASVQLLNAGKLEATTGLRVSLGTLTLTGGNVEPRGTFTVDGGSLTVSGGDTNLKGTLTVSAGTMTLGSSSGDDTFFYTGSTATVSGTGSLNCAGQFGWAGSSDTIVWTQSGGTVTLVKSGSSFPGFQLTSGSTFNMSGGTMVLERVSSTRQYENPSTTYSVTGGTVQFGNASTPNATTFAIDSTAPIFNLVVNNQSVGPTDPTLNLIANSLVTYGSVTIQSGCALNSNSLDLTVGGSWTNDGAFTQGVRTVTFDAGVGTQTIGGAQNTTFYNLVLSNGATRQFGDATNGSKTYQVTNALTWTAGGLRVGQGGLTDTFWFNKASVTATVPTAATLELVGAGSSFSLGTVTATGVKIGSGSTLSLTSASSEVICPGDWTNSGGTLSSSPGTGKVTFNTTGTTNITGSGTNNFGEISISTGATVIIPTTAATTATYNVAGNWSNAGTFTHSLPGGGAPDDTGSTVAFNGTSTLSGSGAFNFYTVKVNAASTLTSSSGNINVAGNWNYGAASATFNHNSGTVTCTGATIVSGTAATTFFHVVITGTLTGVSSGNFNVAGNWANSGVGVGFSHNSGTVTFSGSGPQTIQGTVATTYNNLSVAKSGGTLGLGGTSGTLTVNAALSLSGANAGTFDADVAAGGPALTVGGATTVSGGTLFLNNARTTRFSGGVTVAAGTLRVSSATVELGAAGLTVANGGTFVAGATGRPTITSSSPPTTYPIFLKGSIDVFGITVSYAQGFQCGTNESIGGGTNIQNGDDPPGDTYAATITNLLEVNFANSTKGVLVRNITNTTTASTPIRIRTADFDANVTYNVRVEASAPKYVTVENAAGAKGASPNGEANDNDPGELYVAWTYFNWEWTGVTSTAWALAGNWNWRGGGAPPETYPGATGPTANPNSDSTASKRTLLIPSTVNRCIQNQSYNIQDISLTYGGILESGTMTLGIYGQAFKSSGGTYTALAGNTVEFAGAASQVVILVGANGAFYNLSINKTGGTTATLGSDLSVTNDVVVSSGSFAFSSHSLTQTGGGGTFTVAAASQVTMSGGANTFAGSLANSGSMTVSSGSLTFTAAALTLGGTLDVASATLTCSGATVTHASGTMTLTGSTTFRLAGTFDQTGGTFRATSSSILVTTTDTATPTYYAFRFTGGTVDINGLDVSYVNGAGLYLDTGATITKLDNVSFSSTQVQGAPGDDFCLQIRRSANWTGTFTGISFPTTIDRSVRIVDTRNNGPDAPLTRLTMSLFAPAFAPTVGVNDDTPAGDADILWNAVKVWAGKWKYRREILNLSSGNQNANTSVFVQLRTTAGALGATTPPASTVFGAVSSSDEVRVVYFNGSTYSELARDIGAFSNELIEIYFRRPVNYAGTHKAYIYYGAASPGTPSTAGVLTTEWTEDFESGLGSWTLTTTGGTAVTDAISAKFGLKGLHVQDNSNQEPCNARRNLIDNTRGRIECWFRSMSGHLGDINAINTASVKILTEVDYNDAPTDTLIAWNGGTATTIFTPAVYGDWYRVYIDYVSTGGTYSYDVFTNEISRTATPFAYREGNFTLETALLGSIYVNAKSDSHFDDMKIWRYTRDTSLTSGTVLGNTLGTDYLDVSGDWDDPYNWSPIGVPVSSDEVVFDYDTAAFNYEPSLNVAASVKGLRIANMGPVAANDSFTMSGGANTLTLDTAGFVMTGGKVDWTAGSIVFCKGDVTVSTSVSGGFSPLEGGSTFNLGDNAAAQNVTMAGSSGNSFGTLTLYSDGAPPTAKTVRMLSDVKTQVLNVGKVAGGAANVTLDVGGFTMTVQSTSDPALTVTGSGGAAGTLVMDAAADTVTVSGGGLLVGANGTLTMSNGSLSVAKNWNDNDASAVAAFTGGSVTLTGTGSIKQRSSGTRNRFVGLTISGGTRTIATDTNSNGTLDIDGSLSITGGTFNVGGGAYTHTVGGNFTNNATFTAGASTVNFDAGSGTQTLDGTANTTFNHLTFSGGGTKTIQGSSTRTVNGTLSVPGTATLLLSGAAILELNSAGPHSFASGTTLDMRESAGSRPTLRFAVASTLDVNGGIFRTRRTNDASPRPLITGSAVGNVDFNLKGATIDVDGLTFENGNADGLDIGLNGGANGPTGVLRFAQFERTSNPGSAMRHLTVVGTGSYTVTGVSCSFDANFGPGGANVRADESPDVAGDVTVVLLGATGTIGEASADQDADGTPVGAWTGWCTWADGGDVLSFSPGPIPPGAPDYGEDRNDPSTFTGVQGYITAQYNWFTYNFVSGYALVRSEEDRDANDDGDDTDPGEPATNGVKEDLVYALTAKGVKKSYGPFRVARAPYGRVIGPPWTATLGSSSPGEDVLMFTTTNGFIFVLKDTGAALTTYSSYPLRPRRATNYADDVCDRAYGPLMFDAVDGEGGNANDRFYLAGALVADNRIYVTKCWDPGGGDQRARCDTPNWPLSYGGPPCRSWPAVQLKPGGANARYLHFATDYDAGPAKAHIFRVDLSDGSINQEYAGDAGEPGNHVRGGLQLLDDPGIAGDAQLYVGCFEDIDAPNDASLFAINTDSAIPGSYSNLWTPSAPLGFGDVDSYPNFDNLQVYVGDSEGTMYAVNRTTGGSAWSKTATQLYAPAAPPGAPYAAIRSSPVIPIYGGGPIYVGNDDGHVFRLSRADGTVERTYRFGDRRRVRSLSVIDEPTGPPADPWASYNTYVVLVTHDAYTFYIKVP